MTVKLLYTSNCSRTVPLIYLYCDNFPPDTKYLQKTQPIHIQTPITTKTSVLAMHSPQKSYPLLQVQLKTELFTIILTASSIMFIQSKKKKKLSASIFTEAFTIGEDKSDTVCWSNSQATTRERSNVLCNKNGKLASNLSGITGEDFVAFSHTSKRS